MSKQSYKEKLRSPKWQKLRLEIMERDKFTCVCCNDKETTLNVHHLKYTKDNIWEEPSENLITVCEHCHVELEELKKEGFKHTDVLIRKRILEKHRMMFISNVIDVRIIHYIENKYNTMYYFSDTTIDYIKECIDFRVKVGGENE